jgi:hypothetical protein
MEEKWKLLTESHIALTNCKIGGEEKECVSNRRLQNVVKKWKG